MTSYIRHTVHILSLPTQYTQLTRYKCILMLCSYIFKEDKHESLMGELCVFNRHQVVGDIICAKQKARITEWLHEPNILF